MFMDLSVLRTMDIDKVKTGILKELNAHDGEHVHTFLDDIVGAMRLQLPVGWLTHNQI